MLVSFGETVWDEIANANSERRTLGGVACAVAWQARRLGATARLVSAVGADADGDQALAELERRGLETRWVEVISGVTTARVLVRREPSGPRYTALARLDWSRASFSDRLTSALDGADAFTFALFLQGTSAPLDVLARALADDRRPRWVGCDLNLRHVPDPETLSRAVALSDFVKLNEAELARVAHVYGTPSPAAFLLHRHENLAFVVETRGSLGARLILREGALDFEAPLHAPAAHSLGAGDALMAALLYALVCGEPPELALQAAVCCASAYAASASERDSH